jgi:hypothetical protein
MDTAPTLEITPAPTPEEREAIVAAITIEPQDPPGTWRNDPD